MLSPLPAGRVEPPPTEPEGMFDRAVLVACHPDDEILWFSSVLARIPKVIIAFVGNRAPHVTQGRLRALAAHPKPGLTTLGLTEASVFGLGGRNPIPAPYGVEIANREINAAYRSNYDRIVDRLRPLLEDCRNVYTHGPWGEYGHPEHIQMYRALSELQREVGFCLWFSNYTSKRANRLRSRLAPSIRIAQRTVLATDVQLARQIQDLYVQHRCWTWYLSYRWPLAEELLSQPPGAAADTLASEYSPILLNLRLGRADRLRWMRTAARCTFDASAVGCFLNAIAVKTRRTNEFA